MASLAAPPALAKPGAPGSSGKPRRLAWGIVFLVVFALALTAVIKLIQADLKSNQAAAEQQGTLKTLLEAVEKEKAGLRTRVAELEQKWKVSAELQAELAAARKLSAEEEAELQRATAAKAAAEQELATLKTRLGEVSQNTVMRPEQAQQIQVLQDELGREMQRQESLFQDAAKAYAAMLETEKERAELQAQVDAQVKRMTEVMNATDQIQKELAREKQVSTESEVEIAEANRARAAAAQAMAELKQKFSAGEKQARVLKKKRELLAQRQADLTAARKLSAETKTELQQATAARTAAEQELAALKARLAAVSQNVVTAQDQAQQVQALKDEIGREKQAQESLLAEMAKACAAVPAPQRPNPALPAQTAEAPPPGQLAGGRGDQAPAASEPAQVAAKENSARALLSAGSEATRHFKVGAQKWEAGDVDGAMAEFKKTISLDSAAAAAYYNLALGYIAKGDRYKACDYLYQAGEIYLTNENTRQASRVVEFIRTIDPSSALGEKLSAKIAGK